MAILGVYRTSTGTIWRLVHTAGDALRVELLKDEVWVPGPIAMTGLRLSKYTTALTPHAIAQLPA
jgi:hypothetical protein